MLKAVKCPRGQYLWDVLHSVQDLKHSTLTWHPLDEFPERRCYFSILCVGVVAQGNFPLLTLYDCFCYITACVKYKMQILSVVYSIHCR